MEGIAAMKKHREGKITLRSSKVDTPTPEPVSIHEDQRKRRGSAVPAKHLRPKAPNH